MKLFFCLFIAMTFSSITSKDYKFHSVFIYNFTKYVQWPESKKSGDFIIGVMGDSPLTPYLEAMAKTRTVGDQKLSIRKIDRANSAKKCHIVFLTESNSSLLGDLKEALNTEPTLIITEKPGLGKEGSGINFIQVNGRWKFELNESAVTSQNLKVSSELKKLAIII